MGRGRPKSEISLYDKYVKGKEEQIIEDCRNGADSKGIAKRLGCGLTTFKTLKKESPEFAILLKEGNTQADENVQSALYRRAIGYEYEETVTEVRVSQDGAGNTTFIKKTKKHVPGDTTAQIFWLKNRIPDKWRDRKEITGEDGAPIKHEITGMIVK